MTASWAEWSMINLLFTVIMDECKEKFRTLYKSAAALTRKNQMREQEMRHVFVAVGKVLLVILVCSISLLTRLNLTWSSMACAFNKRKRNREKDSEWVSVPTIMIHTDHRQPNSITNTPKPLNTHVNRNGKMMKPENKNEKKTLRYDDCREKSTSQPKKS